MELYESIVHFVLIYPRVVVAESVEIGIDSVVMVRAVIDPGAKVGKGCIINTSSSVVYDYMIEASVHVSVGTHLSRTVMLEE